MDMASSSSQAATTVDLKKYDVFISFRGEDTRSGFTSHLHAALKRSHLETYIDYRIEKGNQVWTELEKAIKDSTLFLVVFSENYASSTWCLMELVEIMKCHKNGEGGVYVIPVFYQIDPSHVRKQTGSYGTALAEHKKRGKNDDHKMQNWKNALFEAANLSGFHSTTYRTESVFIEDITRDVLQKLNNNYTNELTCNFILDENYWKVQSLIKKRDSTQVQIIGLWGMGGIGKTTLAAAIFQRVSFKYEGSCFLENVTEESKRHGINCTCNKLLSKLLKEDIDIDTSKVIPSMIVRRLKRMKSCIVLDDVQSLELLKKLIGVGHGWLGAGSTVIVTTRDKHVLISGGIDKIHEVKKMNTRNSLQLFSLNAFNKVFPMEGYTKLSKKAIDYAKGNPLAVKVLGSLLCCKSEIEWNCALAKLKEIPNKEIDGILRWSYNELDKKEKDIFLDIACFFKGHERPKVTKILNECGFFADIGIRHLLDKALIRLDFDNCIQMHDLIQEMGKQIVREESLQNPGQRSRLWDPKEVCDVLKNNRGTEIVEAIFLDANEYTKINLSPKAFEKMVNLRLLAFHDNKRIKSVSLSYGLDLLPESLRYFLWDGYPWKSLPPNFCPEMLVELSLQESHVEKLWNGILELPNLELLDLGHSKKLIECPNVSGSPNLTRVLLGGCERLLEVDSSIFHLQKLEYLNTSGCASLKSLSSNTCSSALVELNATDCINLKDFSVAFANVNGLVLNLAKWYGNGLPSSILDTKNLETFYFPMMECLVDLPQNFAKQIWLVSPPNREHNPFIILHRLFPSPAFIGLEHLVISDIPILSEIPDSISLLLSLRELTLLRIAIRSLPETIMYLPRLKQLEVYDCKMLQSIPAFSQFIPFVVIWNCKSLKKVLSSTVEPSNKPNGFVFFNCIPLDPHSYQTVLKDVFLRIELRARQHSELFYGSFLPAMPGIEHWFDYRSTQVSFTLELPPNLLGFSYYMVVSQGHVWDDVDFGCECYLDNNSDERIYITSLSRACLFNYRENSIDMISDHVVLWYDPVICKQIMEEEIKAINDVNNTTGHNPKLTFEFFISRSETVSIKECGFHWIYQEEEEASAAVFESHDQEKTTYSPAYFQSNDQEKIVPATNFEVDETKDSRPLLEELMHIGFGGDNMNPLFGWREEMSNSERGEEKIE